MSLHLSAEEISVLLRDYRLTIEPAIDTTYSLFAQDLLDTEQTVEYLNKIAPFFHSPSTLVTASLFAKRYSVLTMASAFYVMSRYDKGLFVGLENTWVEAEYNAKPWLPNIRLIDSTVSVPTLDREAWRDEILKGIFADNLAKVWQSLTKISKIPKTILWENTAIYVNWLYETKIREGANEQEIARIQEDYIYIVSQAPGSLFGERKNPLTNYCGPKVMIEESEQPVRLRKTCCFYYHTSDGVNDFCISCPKIKRPS
ncbi:IucA/IucC family C-terminal-domain containing protein [Lysinibacillus cavernae]|uniref:IucA/IucC family C-terminal-domain containing protein n=1 Tax=Lysinibacillus cavernae TaxID=2666135 RepID=UPI0012D9386A|nr:IucA/IucC family C-terminal-domain containing protein [Lysinibacillus cavernae]